MNDKEGKSDNLGAADEGAEESYKYVYDASEDDTLNDPEEAELGEEYEYVEVEVDENGDEIEEEEAEGEDDDEEEEDEYEYVEVEVEVDEEGNEIEDNEDEDLEGDDEELKEVDEVIGEGEVSDLDAGEVVEPVEEVEPTAAAVEAKSEADGDEAWKQEFDDNRVDEFEVVGEPEAVVAGVALPLFEQDEDVEEVDEVESGLTLPMFDKVRQAEVETENEDAEAVVVAAVEAEVEDLEAEEDDFIDAVAVKVRGKKKTKRKPKKRVREAQVMVELAFEKREEKVCQGIYRWGIFAAGLVLMGMLLVLFNVYRLQTNPPEQISARMQSQKSSWKIHGRPGNIVDRQGFFLAISDLRYQLFVDPEAIEDFSVFSEKVGEALGYDPVMIDDRLSSAEDKYRKQVKTNPEKKIGPPRFVVIDRMLTDDRLAKLKDFKIKGLYKKSYMKRSYPQGHVAGQIVGKRGLKGIGGVGLERVYNASIKAEDGKIVVERGPKGNATEVKQEDVKSPVDGQNIRLSIDISIQKFAEDNLKAACDEFKALGGQMIVMVPHTGEILAMANYPFFDHSIPMKKYEPQRSRNRCVTDVYEPGSTFKPFVWASALESGRWHMGMMFDCSTSGAWKPPKGALLHDSHPNGTLSFEGVLVKSSNIGMGKIGYKMGKRTLYDVVRTYGFGENTGSGLLGEVGGILRPGEKWSMTDLTRIPMGHGVSVTPLQMARAFCVFGNGGYLITPSILAVNEVRDAKDEALLKQRVLSEKIAKQTRVAMHKVVTDGTGKKANSKIYKVFGKTGTAELPNIGGRGYFKDQYVGSFVAGAPLDNPRVVVLTVIQQPDRSIGHFGGTVAGPATKRTIEQTLNYLGVSPSVWDK